MPTYDYKCTQCGHNFEAFQKISDLPLSDCPHCKATGTVKRMISAGAGIIFKGSGFYSTDYKKNNATPPAPKDCSSCTQSQCPQAEKQKQ